MSVTQAIDARPTAAAWEAPVWLARLDVVFAGLYFDAITAWQSDPDSIPGAWQPLFEARKRLGLQRIQFALAGMNAHINRDLPVAVPDPGVRV